MISIGKFRWPRENDELAYRLFLLEGVGTNQMSRTTTSTEDANETKNSLPAAGYCRQQGDCEGDLSSV